VERARFQLALEALEPHQWRLFEQFANRFLGSEFPGLRPTSRPDGDRGRDSFLWQPEGEESVALQYSVTTSWRSKIRETAKTVKGAF
jgi:hypothetical protein